ncbi:oligosaccharide flippase family protein, partial [Treponema succinifaciens]
MGLVFPLITFPYSSRIIGPIGIGKVNFANSIISYFTIIASLGIFTYATKEAAKIRDSKDELSKFSKEIFTINSISTLVAYFLFFISLCLVPKFHDYKILLCICSSTILFTTLGLSWLYT